MIPKIQAVNITSGYVGLSLNAVPSLEVSWSAVNDPDIRYVVMYNESVNTLNQTEPPAGAEQVTTNSSYQNTVTIRPSKKLTTYCIWVAAKFAEYMGEYSDKANGKTLISELHVICCHSLHSHAF